MGGGRDRGRIMVAHGALLTRLARDRRGNTLAIMAAAMIPLMGFTGSAIDMARLYVVKVRLQQACDAGALAGRKAMTDTSLTTPLDANATTQAQTFFRNNFTAGWYKTTNVVFTPTKSSDGGSATVANAVTATASTTVPMSVMGFFGFGPKDIAVTCQARFDLADTDVMFVLDTTGSMACTPSGGGCGATVAYTRGDGTTGYKVQESGNSGTSMSKIEALRQSVMLFDSTMRSSADPTTHFRYGFVTYSSAVNVGGVIPAAYMQKQWTYQSRHIIGDYDYGSASSVTVTGIPQSSCVAQRYPATGYATSGPSWNTSYYQAMRYYNLTWSANAGGTCSGTQQPMRPMWRYEPVSLDTTQYLRSIDPSAPAVATPGRLDGLTTRWRGCIEEVDTTSASSFDVNNLPPDLNPDNVPTDPAQMWRPMWPAAEWLRDPGTSSQDVKDEQVTEDAIDEWTDYNYRPGSLIDQPGGVSCGMPAKRLSPMTASDVQNYVYNVDFVPFGGTYHDVGMIWGTRLLSPTGLFRNDTAAWPGRNEPSRNIVFMTDGTMSPQPYTYGQSGVEWLDKRITGGSFDQDYARHTARFRVECDAAKKKGFTIYVVALGTGVTDDLTYCASPGQTYQASDTAALQNAFRSIAQRIAMLRITQ